MHPIVSVSLRTSKNNTFLTFVFFWPFHHRFYSRGIKYEHYRNLLWIKPYHKICYKRRWRWEWRETWGRGWTEGLVRVTGAAFIYETEAVKGWGVHWVRPGLTGIEIGILDEVLGLGDSQRQGWDSTTTGEVDELEEGSWRLCCQAGDTREGWRT